MRVIVIYDNSGKIFFTGSGMEPPEGLQFMEVEIPQNHTLSSIDTTKTPHEPVFEKLENRIDSLDSQVTDLQLALAEIYEGMGV